MKIRKSTKSKAWTGTGLLWGQKISEGIQITKHLLQNPLLLKNHMEHCALTPAVYLEVSIPEDTHLAPWRALTRS